MRKTSGSVLALVVMVSCSGNQEPPPPPPPPQVANNALEYNVVGDGLDVSLSVSGCNTVKLLEVLQGSTVVTTAQYNKRGLTQVHITAGQVTKFLGSLGIA